MELAKQYIVQCIISAANNLRLSSEKIEAVALLRERLNKSENLSEEIKSFKKITELSKLGIKLGELYNFIDGGKIDFLKLSDRFKEHSFSLVRELNYVLDIVTPPMMRKLFEKQDEIAIKVDLTNREAREEADKKLDNVITKDSSIPKRSRADELKEALIFEELDKETGFNFEQYEEKVLRPIKELDSFLNRVMKFDYTEKEINSFKRLMNENAEHSGKIGFEVLANMHKVFSDGLDLINQKKIAPNTNVIEALRACLIVIVAVVRGKEVDITSYLNKAEDFGRTILQNKKVV